ncbi:DinB family protein [Williamsia sp. CHRR-6]|uniref:DinB family protein n=1 Tax=Williamsia sp. CHRR-6 TaxID=2835871 RepID=UPI001BDB2849|nr:DinB family protein [Williamsia sp. CHRR-6]MBT0568174.1 DinB family protein [Williamsia sp. CHRR-6]
MPIEPDTKNWTWVLEKGCDDCGFDASAIDFRDIPDLVMTNVSGWESALSVSDPRVRPNDSTWSPLEYAAHVRDVFHIFARRLALMSVEVDPLFENWDQDATAVAERYNDQDPEVVLQQLISEGRGAAAAFEAVPEGARSRTGRRGDGSVFTVESLGRYFVHDPIHHLWDVTGAAHRTT